MRWLVSVVLVLVAARVHAQPASIPLWCGGLEPYDNLGACGATCDSFARFPIGPPTSQGHAWRNTLVTWARGFTAATFDYGAPPLWSPLESGMLSTSPWHWSDPPAFCKADTAAWAVGLNGTAIPGETAQTEVEHLLLHQAGGAWIADALANLNVAPEHFIMPELENTATCEVHVPAYQLDPELTSLGALRYSGNPYFTDPAVRRPLLLRGLIDAAVYLVILDYLWWPNPGDPSFVNGGAYPSLTQTTSIAPADRSTFTNNILPRHLLQYDDFRGNVVTAPPGMLNDFDISGWAMSNFAYVYDLARRELAAQDLPQPVQDAFELAFLTFAERIATQRQLTLFPNLAHRSVVALWLAAWVQGTTPAHTHAMQVYRDASEAFYDPQNGSVLPWGTFHDVGGFDTGYNDLNLLHMAKLMAADPTPGPHLQDAAWRGFDLWGHLVFPDQLVGGGVQWVAPNAFNGRTSQSAATLAGGVLQRFLGGGVAPVGATGLPWSWAALDHFGYAWSTSMNPWVSLACDKLAEILRYWFNPGITNTASGGLPASTLWPTPPQYDAPWPNVTGLEARIHFQPNVAFLLHDSSWFTKWDVAANTAGLLELPFETSAPHFWSAPSSFNPAPGSGAFFYARPVVSGPDELVALVHSGPVGPNVFGDLPEGYGGGQLAALWTPSGGPFVLTRRKGRNGGQNDDWSEWSALPVHAVSFRTGTAITSSTRIITPDVASEQVSDAPSDATAVAYLTAFAGCVHDPANSWDPTGFGVTNHEAQRVSAYGELPGGVFGGTVFTAPVRYRRDILTGHGYVAVQTNLCPPSPPVDVVDEAYETIPLYYGLAHVHHHALPGPGDPGDYTVTFDGPNLAVPFVWNPSLALPALNDIATVTVQRYGDALEITFDTEQDVSLAPVYSVGGYESWNLRVHLVGPGGGLVPTTPIRYVMRVD